MVIILSVRFNDELRAIYDFISKDNQEKALNFCDKLVTSIDILKSYPFIGRTISKNKREYIYKGYVIPYLIDEQNIVILGIYKANEWE